MNEDLSSIFEKLNINKDSISPELIDNIMEFMNKKSEESSTTEENSSNSVSDFDINTILKMKSIMDKMKEKNNNPRSKLLQDLKPYLSESKKNKIDQYIRLDKLIELLPLIGGGDINPRLYDDNQALMFSLIALLF